MLSILFIAILTFYFVTVPAWPAIIAVLTATTITLTWNFFQKEFNKQA